MARLVADKHTEAVVRQANERRQAQWQKEVERTATPLLTWGGVADPTPAPPEIETVEDRLAMRLRRDERSFWKYDIGFRAKDAAERAAGRWYAYLCRLLEEKWKRDEQTKRERRKKARGVQVGMFEEAER